MSFNSVLITLGFTRVIRQMSEHNYGNALWSVARGPPLCTPSDRDRSSGTPPHSPASNAFNQETSATFVEVVFTYYSPLVIRAGGSWAPMSLALSSLWMLGPSPVLNGCQAIFPRPTSEKSKFVAHPQHPLSRTFIPVVFTSPNISDVCFRMLEPSYSISFRLAEDDQGAVLITKYPTYQEDVELIGNFEKYTKVHYDSWVAFARKAGHGDDVKPILVTGVDMTRDFAMMTCPNDSEQRTFRFTTSAPGAGSVWGTWHSKVPIYTNSGPHPSCAPPPTQTMNPISTGIPHADIASNEYDQCVFIRYYTVRKRLGIPRVVRAAAGPHDLGPGGYSDEGSLLEESPDSGLDSDIVSGIFDVEESGSSGASSDSGSDAPIHNTTPVRSSPSPCTYFCSLGTTPYRMEGTISM